jgi:ubiquinone biosynthesis protein Coq4
MKTESTNRLTTHDRMRDFFSNNRWSPMAKFELLSLPENTLGFALGSFLVTQQIDAPPENHDAVHVLTNTGTSTTEEIGLQYYLLGNGSRNPQLFFSLVVGTLLRPMQLDYFLAQYQKGKAAHYFHYLDFSSMLTVPVSTIRQTFKIS